MSNTERAAVPASNEAGLAPSHTLNGSSGAVLCRTGDRSAVSECRHSSAGTPLTDSEREAAIERAARAIERHMAAVHEANNRVPHVFSDFADASASRWMANEARRLMEQLIAGRSQAQIERMERERGLDRPACANEGTK